MSTFRAADVKCPYYRRDDGLKKIICEGILPGTCVHNCFDGKKDMNLQMDIFCCNRYWNCEVCMALDRKYEEEDE